MRPSYLSGAHHPAFAGQALIYSKPPRSQPSTPPRPGFRSDLRSPATSRCAEARPMAPLPPIETPLPTWATAGPPRATAAPPRNSPFKHGLRRFFLAGVDNAPRTPYSLLYRRRGQIAQLVEQRTENPCVGSSTLPLPIPHLLASQTLTSNCRTRHVAGKVGFTRLNPTPIRHNIRRLRRGPERRLGPTRVHQVLQREKARTSHRREAEPRLFADHPSCSKASPNLGPCQSPGAPASPH